MNETVGELFSAAQIEARIGELADDIAKVVPTNVTLVGLLKGAFMFATDLTRALDARGVRPEIEFLQVSSYGLEKRVPGASR